MTKAHGPGLWTGQEQRPELARRARRPKHLPLRPEQHTRVLREGGGGSSYGSGVVVTGFGRGRDRPRVWTHYCWTGHYSTGMSAHLVYKSYLLNLYPFTSPPGWLSSHPLEGIVELPPLSSDNWDGGKRSWACSPCPVMLLLLKLELVTQTAT